MRATNVRFWLGVLAAAVVLAAPRPTAAKKHLAERIEHAAAFFAEVMEDAETAIPRSLLKKASGLIILRQYKAGFIFGVKGGRGIVLAKDEATQAWSPPAFVATVEGSYGLQIGGQAVDTVLLIMNEATLRKLLSGKLKVGVDASAAAGPVGRDAEAKLGQGAAVYHYARAKGLYAGASFEGGVLAADNGANEDFYGVKGIQAGAILYERKVPMPQEGRRLIRLLQRGASSC